MFSSSNVPVLIWNDYRLVPYAIICSVRPKFSMAFSAITVSTSFVINGSVAQVRNTEIPS